MSPGEWKAGGEGLDDHLWLSSLPFGMALVMVAPRGLAGLALADPGEERASLDDMRRRWPKANYVEDYARRPPPRARRIFDSAMWKPDQPLRVVLIGTDFEIRVWEKLLSIPLGKLTTYSDLARSAGVTESRTRGRRRGWQEPDQLRRAVSSRRRQER